MQFYIFNVTNVEEILAGGKPNLQEVGPYTYFQTRYKYDIRWNDEEGTITYKQNKSYFFRPEMSAGLKESDMITTINPIMIGLDKKLGQKAEFLLGLWSLRFSMDLFLTKPVEEWLFKGYEEPILTQLGKITKDPKHTAGRFGFFYPRNNSNDGDYEIYTGAKGMHNFQFIASWRGQTELNFWNRTDCNMINGSEGSMFPRPVSRKYPVEMYVSELCRSIYAVYEKDVNLGPLTLFRFVLPKEIFAETEENKCYCVDEFSCRSSMINVSPCRDGSPVVISTPHFYQGRKKDVDELMGLNPTKEQHETYLDIEPNTGAVLRAAKRIQINMIFKLSSKNPSYKSVPSVIMPILWVNESVTIPESRAEALSKSLALPSKILTYTCWTLIALGIILIFASIIKGIFLYVTIKHQQKKENLVQTNEKERFRSREITNLLNKPNSLF